MKDDMTDDMTNAPEMAKSRRAPREPNEHPEIVRLKREYPAPLRRTCGLPWCEEPMMVGLTDEAPNFKAPGYCSDDHRDFAKRRRKKLRASLAHVMNLLESPSALAAVNARSRELKDPTKTLTKADLEPIARRLKWELAGIPPARASNSSMGGS